MRSVQSIKLSSQLVEIQTLLKLQCIPLKSRHFGNVCYIGEQIDSLSNGQILLFILIFNTTYCHVSYPTNRLVNKPVLKEIIKLKIFRIVSSILVCARSALQNPTKIFEYYSRQCWSYSQNEEVYHTFLPCTFLCKDFEGKHISKCVPTRDPAVLIPLT